MPELLRKKLKDLPEKDLWTAWRQIQSEFAVDEDYPYYKTEDPAVPPKFLLADDIDTVRDRIARFLLEVKPKLFASGAAQGVRESPAVAPPLPAFLAVGNTAARRPTRRQEHLMTEVSQALSLWANADRDTLFEALDLDPKGWLARDSKERFDKLADGDVGQTIGPSHQLRALRRLSAYADAFAQIANPLEALLTAFKHSREVVADDVRKEILAKKKDEIRLQRELASFLIEHGYFAVGTRFARAESDLVIFEGRDPLVVEVKLFRPGKSPTPAGINQAFRQLQDYLDKHKGFQRGILAIFNLSKRPIKAARIWIRGLYRVLAINLGDMRSSKLKTTLEIVEGDADQALRFIGP